MYKKCDCGRILWSKLEATEGRCATCIKQKGLKVKPIIDIFSPVSEIEHRKNLAYLAKRIKATQDTQIFCGKCIKRYRKIEDPKLKERFKCGTMVNGRCDRCEQHPTAKKG